MPPHSFHPLPHTRSTISLISKTKLTRNKNIVSRLIPSLSSMVSQHICINSLHFTFFSACPNYTVLKPALPFFDIFASVGSVARLSASVSAGMRMTSQEMAAWMHFRNLGGLTTVFCMTSQLRLPLLSFAFVPHSAVLSEPVPRDPHTIIISSIRLVPLIHLFLLSSTAYFCLRCNQLSSSTNGTVPWGVVAGPDGRREGKWGRQIAGQ